MTTKTQLPPEVQSKLEAARAKAARDRHLEGPPPALVGEGIRFAMPLLAAIGKLTTTRKSAGLSVAQVARSSGIAETTLNELEAGELENPTWKVLGDYAHAVGCKLNISIESA